LAIAEMEGPSTEPDPRDKLTIVILTVPDPRLEALLASAALLAGMRPTAVEDMKVLLGALLLAAATLADVLKDGLVRLFAPALGTTTSQVSLSCGEVVLTGFASDRRGNPVADPHLRPADVRRLAVSDVTVGGSSIYSRVAG
jgi:hypothetical protein